MGTIKHLYSKNRQQLSSVGILVFIIVALSLISKFFVAKEEGDAQATNEGTSVVSPYIPEDITFCNEEVPIDYYDVFESLERELIVNTYFHSQTILNIKRANRFFPLIEPVLKKNNIPDDFKYLALAESGFGQVVSPKGAAGFWQLLEGTAEDYGLEVNDEVDERYHLEKSTEAACKYILESYEKFENWTMVAASYNVGRRGVQRQIDRQGEAYYYDLLFNEETARYVFRILALKIILENPEKYNFDIPDMDQYQPIPYKEIVISGAISDMGVFAKEHQTNYKLLKYLNPWLRDSFLTNKTNKEYTVRIPTRRKI